MSAVGYAVLPTTISLSGLSKELQKQVLEPTRKAAKQAAETMEKGIGAGAEAAGRAVEKANFRVMKSTQEQEAAESKLAEQKLKTEAANLAVEAAARKRADAETKGVEAVEKAEQELLKKRAAAEKASRDLRTAEAGVEKALSESARAADNLAEKQRLLDAATEDTEESTKGLRERLREVAQEADSTGGMFDGLVGKVGGMATAFAGIAGVGALFAEGMDISGQIDKMNLQLGTTGAAAEAMGEEVTAVMRSGFGAEEAVSAIGSLNSQFAYLGSEGEQTAAELSDNFIAFAEVFEVDMAEATQTAGQLVKNGLAGDVEEAADLMTAAMQRVPAQMRDELPEIINEYGVNFKNLGFSGEEAFGMLVAQAENGKIALDKTGDALKEFSLFAVDPAKAEVFESIGINAAEMATAVAEGGDKAQAKLQETAQALLEIEDPGLRATTAIELFGTPLEDLGVEGIPAFLEGLSGAGEGMAGFEGSSQAAADVLANSLQGRLDKAKNTVMALAGEAFMQLWDVTEDKIIPALKDVSTWAQDNEKWLTPLAVAVGGMATGMAAWAAATKLYAFAQGIATGAFKLFDKVTRGSMIGLIVTAVTGLVAALIWFFRETELGQEIWAKFTEFLRTSWEKVSEKFGEVWDWIRENVFEAFGTKVQEVKMWWQDTTDSLSNAWQSTKDTFSAVWESIKAGVFDAWNAYVNQVKANWDTVTNALNTAWTWVKDTFSNVWNTIKTAVFDAWTTYVNNVKSNWDTVTGALSTAWTWTKDQFVYVWTVVKATVFDAWNTAVETVRSVFDTVTAKISESWTWLKDNLVTTWTTVKTTVFDAMTSALDTVKGWFDKTVDAIGTTWDKLKALTAKPVRFVVETVYGGIRNAWNKVAGLVGLGELPEVPLGNLGAYARGGVLPGYTPGRDVHEFYSPTGGRIHLSGGEAIMRPEWVRAVGGPSAVDEMNRAAREGKSLAAGPHDHYALGGVWDLGAFANGGTLRKNPGVVLTTDIQRSMERAVAAAFPNQIITSATRYQEMGSGYDNHMAGRALDFAASHALADWIARTYPHSAELFWDPGPNLKNGRPTGAIGGHSDHVHWAMASMVDPYTGEVVSQDGPGGGGGFSLLGMAKGMWDKAIGAIGKFPGAETMGTIGKLPAAALSTLADGAWNFLKEKFAAVGSFFGGGGGGEQYRGQIEAAFRNQGEVPHKHLVDALVRQIDTESGGDPNIAQQIVDVNGTGPSAGLGLYQFIPGTFAAYRDPSLPNDRTDPWAAHNAAVRYFRDRHGWNTGPGGVGRGHGWKSGGVLPADLTTLFDTGGVWKHGTAGVNLSGADEYVFTNKAMRSFENATESLQVVATELGVAFRGGDWGYMELARYLGDDMAKATIEVVAAVGRADRGFREWAAATEEQDRIGTPEEWARHYGAQAGATILDDVLGLFGLGGIVGSPLKASLVDLVNAAADTMNGIHGTRFGHISENALVPAAVLDDQGRAVGTKLVSADSLPEPADTAAAAGGVDATSTTATVTEPPVKEITFEVKGDAVTTEKVSEMFDKLNGELGDTKVRLKKIEDNQTASVTSGVAGIV